MKTAIITGCNKGLGLKLLERFSKDGFNVIAINRKQYDEFDEITLAIESECSNHITKIYADLSDETSIDQALQSIAELGVSIDVLVNNAGTNIVQHIFNTEYHDLETIFKVNYFGPLMLTKGIANLMIHASKGSIINISSTMALHPDSGLSGYGASKAALNYFTESVGQELAPFGVRLNAVACGPMESTMYETLDDKARKKMLKRVAMGRIANPSEIIDVVCFLASEKASYITGSVISVDGGYK